MTPNGSEWDVPSPGIRTAGTLGTPLGCPASEPFGRRWVHGALVPLAEPAVYPKEPASHCCE